MLTDRTDTRSEAGTKVDAGYYQNDPAADVDIAVTHKKCHGHQKTRWLYVLMSQT